MSTSTHRILAYFTLATLFNLVAAQFAFFDNMWGQQQQQQQHRGGAEVWQAQAEALPCGGYQCPSTLECVTRPVECPCPHPQDIKCVIPEVGNTQEATVLCVRGEQGCGQVERLMKRKF